MTRVPRRRAVESITVTDEPPRRPRHNLGLTARLGPVQLTADMLQELGAEAERRGSR